MTVRLWSLALFIVLIAGWEAACRGFGIAALLLPPPSAVLATLWHGLVDGYLWPHIWLTALEMLLGLVLGCAIGFICGVALGETDFLRRVLSPYIVASPVVPKLALVPLFIFGFGMPPIIVITALICFFPLLENTMTAMAHVEPQKLELFRMLGASKAQTLFRLKVPAGLPVILAGVRVAVVLSLVGAVVAEFFAGRDGLGALIIAAQGMMDSAQIFASLTAITLLAERWLLRRHVKGAGQ
jgi:NitT/TauT family transport system permease protein